MGTAVFNVVASLAVAAGPVTEFRIGYSFVALKGRKYKMTKGGLAGTTETVASYSYTDF